MESRLAGSRISQTEPFTWTPKTGEHFYHTYNLRHAALHPFAKKPTTVEIKYKDDDKVVSFVLCTLRPEKTEQCTLDLIFSEEITFSILKGDGPVHLLGMEILQIEEDGYREEISEASEDSEEEAPSLVRQKRKINGGDEEVVDKSYAKKKSKLKKMPNTYIGSVEETDDLVKNYKRCGGDWSIILKYQPLSQEEDVPRYKKIIKQCIKEGKAKRYSAEEQAEILAELFKDMSDGMSEESLDNESSSDELDDDMDEPTEQDIDFINDESEESGSSEEKSGSANESGSEEDVESMMKSIAEDGAKAKKGNAQKKSKKSKAEAKIEAPGKRRKTAVLSSDSSDEDEAVSSKKTTATEASTPKNKKKSDSSDDLQTYIERLTQSPNVPKKVNKFKNFCKNNLKIEDSEKIEKLWDAYQKEKST